MPEPVLSNSTRSPPPTKAEKEDDVQLTQPEEEHDFNAVAAELGDDERANLRSGYRNLLEQVARNENDDDGVGVGDGDGDGDAAGEESANKLIDCMKQVTFMF
jgi:hypothetical protein